MWNHKFWITIVKNHIFGKTGWCGYCGITRITNAESQILINLILFGTSVEQQINEDFKIKYDEIHNTDYKDTYSVLLNCLFYSMSL